MLDPRLCRRLVVFGGSFDPPHRAHASLPFLVADRLQADGVLFVPAGQPPHKRSRTLAPGSDRLAMLRLALHDHPRAAVTTLELDLDGPSYSVRTLELLRDRLGPGVELRLLIGADMLAIFYQWREPRRIIDLAEPVVMARPPVDHAALLALLPPDLPAHERDAWNARLVEVPPLDVSSTELRRLLAAGKYDAALVRDALDPAVLDYIRARGLYHEA